MFVKNHDWHALFTFDEVVSAYHVFLRALLTIAAAAVGETN
jgi:hypothetical protein